MQTVMKSQRICVIVIKKGMGAPNLWRKVLCNNLIAEEFVTNKMYDAGEREHMDLVIFYQGEQNVLELKIWRGKAYNERGEKQLEDYLDYFHMKKGYMLSFNFNKKKHRGFRK